MKEGKLGKVYEDGEFIIRQGEMGNCMFVVQSGKAEIFREADGVEFPLRIVGPGEFFGEMALVENQVRSASVRSVGQARILRIDKRTFMRRVHEDPSLAYRIMQSLSHEVRRLATELDSLKAAKGVG